MEFYDDDIELAQSGVERSMYCATRPLLELIIRRRLAASEGIELRGGCTFLDYRHNDHLGVVEGVRIQNESGKTTTLEATLVVDATGRTSRTPG